jgi:sugar O-acyltransferase (sialic acid O-acetyltransferase NeuD family)
MNLIIIGGNSGARLCFDIAIELGFKKIFFFENFTNNWGDFDLKDLKFIESIEDLKNFLSFEYFIATGDNESRSKHFNKFSEIFKKPPINLIHPKTTISKHVKIGYGNLICAGVIINNNTIIGNGNIINTSTIVEHDNVIGHFSQLSPNSTLCGYVTIENYVFIGAGSIIIPNVTIPNHCLVGAGSVVIKSPKIGEKIVGVPAKSIKYSK